jgi:hypothetical protein
MGDIVMMVIMVLGPLSLVLLALFVAMTGR